MRRALALAALAWLLAASLAAAEDEETPDLAAAALPAPVAGLTVVIGGPDALTLRWDAPDDGGEPAVTRYEVERSEDGEQWVAVPLSEGPRALRDSPLTMGQRYWYRVRAVGEAGPGAWSEPVSGVPAAPPAAVDDLAVAEVRGGTVTLTWSQPAEHGSPIFRYELERLYGAGHDIGVGFWAFSEWPPEHETFSFDVRDALVTPGRAYRVRGWNAAGESEWSEPAIVEGADVPARPPRIAITAIGPREVSVRWQAAAPRGSAVFSHEVERRYGLDHLLGYDHWAAEEWVAGRTWATIETSFTGVARTFRARAWNLVGEGAWSPWAGVQPGLLAVSGTHEEFREMLLAQCPRGFEVYGSPAAVGDARLIPYVIAPGGDDEAQRAANEVFAAAYPGRPRLDPAVRDGVPPPGLPRRIGARGRGDDDLHGRHRAAPPRAGDRVRAGRGGVGQRAGRRSRRARLPHAVGGRGGECGLHGGVPARPPLARAAVHRRMRAVGRVAAAALLTLLAARGVRRAGTRAATRYLDARADADRRPGHADARGDRTGSDCDSDAGGGNRDARRRSPAR